MKAAVDPEFDRHAAEYESHHRANVKVSGERPEYFAAYKIDLLCSYARAAGLAIRDILDFGSGIGNSVPHFTRCFPDAQLTCADVSSRSLEMSAGRHHDQAHHVQIEGGCIPAPGAAFDLIFSACVFHHIGHEEHTGWLRELGRVSRPGALLTVFEHNPLNPLTVHAVNTCPFDANARLLRAGQLADKFTQAGWLRPQIRYHLFFPRILSALRPLEHRLGRVPFGAQYSVTARRPA